MRYWFRSCALLVKWNFLRLRSTLFLFMTVQMLLSCGIAVGFAFLIPDIDDTTAMYLTTGSMAISLIILGLVIAPQVLAQQKLRGVFDFQRSLPVPRLAMLAADSVLWLVMALPGVAATLGVAALRFDLELDVNPLLVLAILLVSATAVCAGYCIAYAFKPELANLATNMVSIIALMYAPINFPAERLPDWLAAVHNVLPLTYMAEAIRDAVDPAAGTSALPYVVLTAWSVLGLAVAYRVMSRRA